MKQKVQTDIVAPWLYTAVKSGCFSKKVACLFAYVQFLLYLCSRFCTDVHLCAVRAYRLYNQIYFL